ncbi:MAG TPA: hypothetical protein DD379_20120 [Cyanobacteria bacterium UBA11162]|nr:hypothetical protein [Cyanobacteria bacterium UBA11162]
MKHRDWLRLQFEGEKICAILRQKGYQCQKQPRRLSWWVSQEGSNSYILTYSLTPIRGWSVFPNDCNPARAKLKLAVRNAVNTLKTQRATQFEIEEVVFSNTGGVNTISPDNLVSEYDPRPWTIVRLLPFARHYTVARFFNRQDAHDHLRFLNRFMPAAQFEIIFDPPDDLL